MKTEHERLKEILAEAAGKDTPEARATYLDAACQDDTDLRRQVETLLAAHDQAGDFLEQSVVPPEATPGGEGPGSVIGRYKLLEEIGEGGFGRVFMAEQTAPVHRKVALKITRKFPPKKLKQTTPKKRHEQMKGATRSHSRSAPAH